MSEAEVKTPLSEILDVCEWCPYGEILTDQSIGEADIDEVTADFAEVQDTDCRSVTEGKCKLAKYSIKELFKYLGEAAE